ncbi:MAG TPA: GNAT family N-acetyltransferase [Thermoleophilaceae bacterium]|jgi:ribosomal protein S18 acetylase RimI-like enzyme
MTDATTAEPTDRADDRGSSGPQPEVRIVKAPIARLDEVKPLWFMLHNHHIAVADKRRGPARSDEESWQIKRGWYDAWLAQEGSFLLLAEVDRKVVGYAVVRTMEPDPTPTWLSPPKKAEIEALAILPDVQRLGVGKLMTDAIKSESYKLGLRMISGAVIGGNEEAVRFYEREGGYVTYVKVDFRFDDDAAFEDPGVVDQTAGEL